MRNILQNRWDPKSNREKLFLRILALLGIFIFIYIFIWNVLNQKLENLQQTVNDKRTRAAWMMHATQQIQSLQQAGVALINPSQDPILIVIEHSLAENKLSQFLQKATQSQNNTVQLVFNKVPFDQFIAWLRQIVKQNAYSIPQLNAKAGSSVGTVDATLLIQV